MSLKRAQTALSRLPVPAELVARRIYLIRGQKVMIDSDLAELYQVSTSRLNEAVKRNAKRFPEDFMFQLTGEEAGCLTSQIAMSKAGRGGRRTLPFAFTEHGVAMLSSVLNSERAVQMNIVIIRAFVKLREVVAGSREMSRQLERVEARLEEHGAVIAVVVDEIKKLKAAPACEAAYRFCSGARPIAGWDACSEIAARGIATRLPGSRTPGRVSPP